MTKVFIYGGCTSRDAVDLWYPQYNFELQHYVARQSLISAFKPADPKEFSVEAKERPFQRRMLEGDIKGNLPSLIRQNASQIDLLIWDIMIERVGVSKVRSGGFVTRNGIDRAPQTGPVGGAYIFGTPEHIRLWSWALKKFVSLVDSLGLRDKVVLNATPWAITDKHGNAFESASEASPKWFNRAAEFYWNLAEAEGLKVARISQENAIADPDHKWGAAYFHYTPDTYKEQLNAITAIM